MKYTSKEIAKWFIQHAAKDAERGGEYITQLKLQKLLYYAKGFYFVFENEPLFGEKIYKQTFGPVVNNLITSLKKYGRGQIISEFEDVNDISSVSDINILSFVYDKVGRFSASALVGFTHQEEPFIRSEDRKVIPDELISSYFRSTYLNGGKNAFGITQKDIYEVETKNNLAKHKLAFERLAQ